MILTALSTLGSLGAAAYGAYESAKANREALEIERENYEKQDALLQSRLRSPYSSRTDFQDIYNRQKQVTDELYARARQTNVVAGGTDAAVAMQKQAAADALASTMGKVASGAADYKDSVMAQRMTSDANHTQFQTKMQQAQAASIAAAAGQATKAMSGLAAADDVKSSDVLKMFGLGK